MEIKKKSQMPSFPEWDLKEKSTDSRFLACQRMQMKDKQRDTLHSNNLKVLYWVGTINVFQQHPRLCFTTIKNELVPDQFLQRDEMLRPIKAHFINYDLNPILFILNNAKTEWVHFLIEELIYADGRHIVRIVAPDKHGIFWHACHSRLLDEKGKTVMRRLFKTESTKEDRIVILRKDAYLETTLNVMVEIAA